METNNCIPSRDWENFEKAWKKELERHPELTQEQRFNQLEQELENTTQDIAALNAKGAGKNFFYQIFKF